VVTLSLRPTDVHAIVFWSKNYAPFLRYLDDLDAHGLDCSFHYAITGYSADPATRPLETRVPHPNHTLDSFARLVEHYSTASRKKPVISRAVVPSIQAEYLSTLFQGRVIGSRWLSNDAIISLSSPPQHDGATYDSYDLEGGSFLCIT
jgi:hypothetical protein